MANDPVNAAVRRAVGNAAFIVVENIRRQVVAAAAEAPKKMSPTFRAVSQSIQGNVKSRKAFVDAHQDLAALAQDAVLESYDDRVTNDPERLPSYRVGRGRLSGGILRRALAQPGMFVGTFEGVALVNKDILNREAKHWGRLNFGAGNAQSLYGAEQAAFRIGNKTITVSTASGFTSPGFRMPAGYWGDGGAGYGFYPTVPSGSRTYVGPIRSIAGRHFLDASVVAVGEQIGNVYFDLVARLLDEARRTGRGAGTHITVTPGQLGL